MEHIDKTIEELRIKIAEKEEELAEMKKTVNQLCKMMNHSPIYRTEIEPSTVVTGLLRGDEYYMQPIATVLGWILEKRKLSGLGPAAVREIYDAMKAGGYKFDAKDDENAMRGISISMCKNVAKFHRLPSGKFGLTEWYPDLKEKKEEPVPTKTTGHSKKKGRSPKTSTLKTITPLVETKEGEPKE